MARPERVLDPTAGPVQEFAAALRELRRAAGNPGYRALAARTGYSPSTLSDAAGGRRLPGLAVVRSLVEACAGDAGEWEQRWRRTAATVAAQSATGADDGDRPPYLGLASFQVADADRYFGREALVAALARRAADNGLLAVVGDSGSGKSSLVRAGLVPALSGPADPPALVITPGERPMDEHRARLADPPRVVAVDQFEEVFTVCRDGSQRRDFIDALLAAADRPDVVVLLALRPDFYGHCAAHERLAAALAGATAPLGPMSDEELARAITAPARRAGVAVERALIATLLADAAGQAGALPLISHAMLETWRHRQGSQLTLAAYEATGGLTGAVARTAEQEYAALDDTERLAARDLLIRLTALGEGTADTRRRVYVGELDRPGTAAVVERFARARLLVVGEDTVEVAHEALIGTWPRLRTWLTEDRDALRLHRRLTDAATVWDGLGREPGDLYRGTRLTEALEWVDRAGGAALNAVEREFLRASAAAAAAEAAAATRRARQVRRLNVGLAALLVLALLGTVAAIWQWRRAIRERQDALSRQLAAEAMALVRADAPEALRLAAAAHRAADTPEARGALLSLAGYRPYSGKLDHHEVIKDVALSPDGNLLAVAGQDGILGLWHVPERREIARLTGHHKAIRTLDFHPAGRYVASGGADGTVRIWDAADPAAPARLLRPGGAPLNAVEFSPDGSRLAGITTDGAALVWRVADGAPAAGFRVAAGDRSDVHFHPRGDRLAVAEGNGRVAVRDLRTGRAVWSAPPPEDAQERVRFDPTGTLLASSGGLGTITLRDAATGAVRRTIRGHVSLVRAIVFNPRSPEELISGDATGVVYVWNVHTGNRMHELVGNTAIPYGLTISADGGTIASGGRDRSALLWHRGELPMQGPEGEIGNLTLSPDGRTLAATDPPQVSGPVTVQETLLWDTATRAVRATDHADVSRPPRAPARPAPIAVPPQPVLTWYQRQAHVWDGGSGKRVRTFGGFPDRQFTGTLDAAAGLLAIGGADRQIRLFDIGTGALVATTSAQPDTVFGLRFTADGRRLVSVAANGVITVLDPRADAVVRTIANGARAVDVAIRADGAEVAIGEDSGDISIWSVRTGERVRRLTGHAGPIDALAYSPDGRTLASGSHDMTLGLWDLRSGARLATLRGHRAAVTTAVWSPDGRTLYTGGADAVVIPWLTDVAAASRRVCATLLRNFPDHPADDCRRSDRVDARR
ncbi:hypothetical protein GCM10010123_43420 [Pilimelia anulata]|uniref:HTH cro/C1-type domain-containing protein n=1 Tax=Pilimelia anulata TaxID=53371 RepID=A0A8J3BBQ3_9ACTN|nr:PQQ-binding-like beta-propeller repeat protein [Pilimelia anulata]GGK08873.1 hypothetical protein GCM10010123_43420 [Pilimelia anulata]